MLNRGSLPIATQKQKKVVSQPNPYEDRLLRMCSFIWLHVESYQKIKIVKISVFMLTSSCVRQECTFELTTTILHGIQSAAHR